jgi:formyltetrahydrofolate-dependent phosphoribosylglycinamide formyltransferase
MVRQINGHYAVKSENLKPLYEQCLNLLDGFTAWKMQHIPREKNKKADSLVNLAMEKKTDLEEWPEDDGEPIRIGVLISGGGRTMMNILDHIKTGILNAEITVVISSHSNATGVEKARNAGLNVRIIKRKDFADIDAFSGQLAETLNSAKVDLVVQAGWLCLWKIPDNYINRVMNIHPALLPSFGGQGMWGHHVHEAVLKAGCKVSGCTVHFCTNEYDKGPIILQRCCRVADNDTPETLAERVFEQECIAYPEAIRLFVKGNLSVQNGIVKINKLT